jgi:hypothetical protein
VSYDEEASEAEHMDVVHEIVMHDRSQHMATWVAAMIAQPFGTQHPGRPDGADPELF